MLTCKSLFGLGYRGERLIEPLFNCIDMGCKVVKKDAEKAGLSGELVLNRGFLATSSNCRDISSGRSYRRRLERGARHRGESRGHGKKGNG